MSIFSNLREQIASVVPAVGRTFRMDSWKNLLTSVDSGGGRNNFVFQREYRIDDQTLEDMFHGDAYAARIVSAVPEDALRRGFRIKCGDSVIETAIQSNLEEHHLQSKVTHAWTWAKLFGGAVIFVGADDGRDPSWPLDLGTIASVRFLTVCDKREVFPMTYVTDSLSPRFGEPATYRFSRIGGSTVDVRSVHASRMIRFDGALTTRRRRAQNQSWSESELQRIVDRLRQFNGNSAAMATLLQDASQAVFKIKNLMGMIASDKSDMVKKRLELMDMARSVSRAIMVDAEGEDFTRVETGTLTGVAEVLDKSCLILAGAAGMPVTRLMGQSPAGLNATGDSDVRWWYDRVDAQRTSEAQPAIERIVRILMRAKNGPTGGVEPQNWSLEWPSLYQPSDAETADIRAKQASVDVQYITAGVLTPAEVKSSRFRGDGYSLETAVEPVVAAAIVDGAPAVSALTAGQVGAAPLPTPTPIDHTPALEIVAQVAARKVPRASGIAAMTAAISGLSADQAEAIMGETGNTFFTAPDPADEAELQALKSEYQKAHASLRSTKQMLTRVLEQNRNGQLVVGSPIAAAQPTVLAEGEALQPGDVIEVPVGDPALLDPTKASAAPPRVDAISAGAAPVVAVELLMRSRVAIVLPVPLPVSVVLAAHGTELAADLHLTLAFFEEMTEDQYQGLLTLLKTFASGGFPVRATLSGLGRFAATLPELDPVWVSVDAPDLQLFRDGLIQIISLAGVFPSDKHGFTPHITIAYIQQDDALTTQRIGPIETTFDRIALWSGGCREELSLAATSLTVPALP